MAHSAIRMGEDTTRIEEMPTVTIALMEYFYL